MGTSAAVFTAGAAYAADPVEFEVEGEVSTVAGVVDGDAKGDVNAEVAVKGSTVLDNGVEVGAVVEGRLDADLICQLLSRTMT